MSEPVNHAQAGVSFSRSLKETGRVCGPSLGGNPQPISHLADLALDAGEFVQVFRCQLVEFGSKRRMALKEGDPLDADHMRHISGQHLAVIEVWYRQVFKISMGKKNIRVAASIGRS